MELRQLRYALSVAKERSFTRAATRLNVSQSAVSEQVSLLEGEIGFRSEDKEIVLGPGGYIVKPRGEVHAMWNAGLTPARMIEIISPAGFEELFRTVVGLTERGEAEMSKLVELANRYEVPMAEPEWFADVIERYQLSMPTP